jgi:hypothetical protein
MSEFLTLTPVKNRAEIASAHKFVKTATRTLGNAEVLAIEAV